MPVCGRCGEDNPQRAKFCMECAAPLAADTPSSRELRKTLTILFTDIVGSTTLGERLDPESVRGAFSRYFEEAKRALERHGGSVERLLGDAVMGVFGLPELHEDDAFRAVRTALEMREVLTLLNEEFERDWGFTVEARTGLNTGEVVIGHTAGERLLTGDAVNVAARLEQAAGPGGIMIGPATYRLVKDAVDVEPVEALVLKGKSLPLRAFRVLGLRPGRAPLARRFDSPLVGRDLELALLRDAFDRSIADRACRRVTVVGAAGVGKSRLGAEFLASLNDQASVLKGRCLPYGEGITFWPVAEVARQAAGITPDDSAQRARLRLVRLVEGATDGAAIAERVATLLGLSASAAPLTETFWAVRRLLETLGERRPLVVELDDLHWAEPAFLDLVEHIVEQARDTPILLLCGTRPELIETRPAWREETTATVPLFLEPLGDDECETLISNLLGRSPLATDALRRITQGAEGNPLFVEELLATFVEEGLLRREDGVWVSAADLSAVTVPPTISGLLAARLDRLAHEERVVIEGASVVGRVFGRDAVVELSPKQTRPSVDTHLETLARKEFIRPVETGSPTDAEFRFRHILVRDAAYSAIPKKLRARLHERFADWLERSVGDRIGEFEEIVGYHLEEAHRHLIALGPVTDHGRGIAHRAGRSLASAGLRAYARDDPAAVNLLSRADALLPPEDPLTLEVFIARSRRLMHVGELSTAETVIAEALDRARAQGNSALDAHARLIRLDLGTIGGRGTEAEAIEEAPRLRAVFREAGDELGLAYAYGLEAYVQQSVRCRFAVGEELYHRGAEHARRAGSRELEALNLANSSISAFYGPTEVGEGIRRCEEILERIKGSRAYSAFVLRHLGALWAMKGEFDRGRALLADSQAVLEDLGMKLPVAGAALEIAFVESLAGDIDATERALRHGYEALESIGDTGIRTTVSAMLAHCLFQRGDPDGEADRFAGFCEANAAEDDVISQILWRSARAKLRAASDDAEEGERLGREAVAISEGTDSLHLQGDALMDMAEVLRQLGRPEETVPFTARALDLYERKGDVVSAASARRSLPVAPR